MRDVALLEWSWGKGGGGSGSRGKRETQDMSEAADFVMLREWRQAGKPEQEAKQLV